MFSYIGFVCEFELNDPSGPWIIERVTVDELRALFVSEERGVTIDEYWVTGTFQRKEFRSVPW